MTLPFGSPLFANPPAPYAKKPSIVDRVLGRLFPTAQYAGLLDPEQQQGLQRQGLLNVGLNLLQAGAPSANQRGTLANIGASIQGVNFPQMAEQALQMQAYRQQLMGQRAIAEATARHPAQPGENREAAYNRLTAIASEVIGISPELGAKFAPILAALKPDKPSNPQEVSGIVDNRLGSPTVGQSGTFLIPFPGAPKDQWQFLAGKPREPKEPTPQERVAGSQYASADESIRIMREIAQRNPEAAKAAAAAVHAGGFGKLGKAYAALRGFTSDPDAQNFYTQYKNMILAITPTYGGARPTQQLMDLEQAASLPAIGSGDFDTAFRHMEQRLADLQAKAGRAMKPTASPRANTSRNPFRTGP